MSKYFSEMRVKGLFSMNGNDYVKQSSRTARMLSTRRVFYFRAGDVVHPFAY